MFTMNRIQRLASVMLVLLLMLVSSVAVSAQTVDQYLQANDYYVMQQFGMYPADNRYNQYLNHISQKLNSSIVTTFGEDKSITFYVCPSPLGFNAVSFHRFIVFDSLLLDSLRYLAAARVYYGTMENEYMDALVKRVAVLHAARQQGNIMGNYYDNDNPFNLPRLPGQLTPQQQQQAQKLFIDMLASWMAHEGSHCMRDHMKYRLQVMQQKANTNSGGGQQFMNAMDQYSNAKLSQELEKDADVCATKWLKNSGFSADGYITWLKFGERLEALMGTDNAYLRTHPKCSTRIEYIRQAYKK